MVLCAERANQAQSGRLALGAYVLPLWEDLRWKNEEEWERCFCTLRVAGLPVDVDLDTQIAKVARRAQSPLPPRAVS